MKVLLILHDINQFLYIFGKKRPSFNLNFGKIVALGLDLKIYLQQQGVDYIFIEDYLRELQPKLINSKAFNLAENWYNDLFSVRGISLGNLVEYELKFYLSRIFRLYKMLIHLIDTENPDKIITIKYSDKYVNEFNEILQFVANIKGIELSFISFNYYNSIPVGNKLKSINRKQKNLKLVNIKPLNLFLKKFLRLLLIIKKRKINTLIREPIIAYQYRKYQNLINKVSKQHLTLLLENFCSNKQQILCNLWNCLLRKRNGKFYIFLDTFNSKKNNSDINRTHKKITRLWEKYLLSPEFEKKFFYDEISLWPILQRKFNKIIYLDFKMHIKNIYNFFYIIKELRPKLLVLNHDVVAHSKSLAALCSEEGIKTLVLQHGLIVLPLGYIPSISTKFAAWGINAKTLLNNYGMNSDKIIITGCSRFDNHIKVEKNEELKQKIKRIVYRDFNINKKKKVIVLATDFGSLNEHLTYGQPNLNEIERFYKYSFKAINGIPNSHLIIKIHPGDKNINIPLKLKEIYEADNVSIVYDYDIIKLIIACVCFISGLSSSILEALLFKKFTIFLDVYNFENKTLFSKYKSLETVSDFVNLKEKIINSLESSNNSLNHEEILSDYLYKIDGLSTQRIINLINDLII